MERPLTATSDVSDWISTDFETGSDIRLESILRRTSSIAIVGASPRPQRPSHAIMAYLLRHGFAVAAINPQARVETILGAPVVSGLDALESPVDLILIFRAPAAVPAIVNEAIAQRLRLGIRTIWMQPGAGHIEAARAANAAGFAVVVERCLQVEHSRLAHLCATDSTEA